MAKKESKIPERFRKFVEPLLMKDEMILCAFKESFRLDEFFFRRWLVLTNLRLMVLSREIPGIRMEEYHLPGMTIEMFKDDFGVYNSVEFKLGGQTIYQLAVFHKRWEEAEDFVHRVSRSIEELNFELRSESDNSEESNPETNDNLGGTQESESPKETKKCSNNKQHLKDLKSMGVINEQEYQEDVNKACETEK